MSRKLSNTSETRVDEILCKMRADDIPAGEIGLWNVRKFLNKKYILSPDKTQVICPGNFTQLSKVTMNSVHLGGECVMADYDAELRTHLQFVLKARGSVLVSGLGLGCVVRGLLCKAEVTFVDIVEKEQAVIDLVWPHMPKDPRLHLHKADIFRFNGNGRKSWDYGWHDIWTEGNKDLQKAHGKIMVKFFRKIARQGAWKFPHELKRVFGVVA